MSVRVVAYDVRYRIIGADDTAWITERVPVGPSISLTGMSRGTQYEIQVRSVGDNGRSSEWVSAPAVVANTNRVGALALPTNIVGNQASMWDVNTSVTYQASSNEAGQSVATISVSAGTLVIGGASINYGASSAQITGAAGTAKTIYLYYDDPMFQGGSRTLGIADNIVDSANVDGRIAITSLSIQFPAAGATGGGGGGIGGGGGGGGARDRNQLQAN